MATFARTLSQNKQEMVAVQLLMMLEYWREYRTYFHIGQAYGLSESAAYRNIKWCEDTGEEQSLSLAGPQVRCGERTVV
jgi:hypothetical protein